MAGETQASHQSMKRIQSVFEVTVRDIRKRGGQRKFKTEGNKSGAGLTEGGIRNKNLSEDHCQTEESLHHGEPGPLILTQGENLGKIHNLPRRYYNHHTLEPHKIC